MSVIETFLDTLYTSTTESIIKKKNTICFIASIFTNVHKCSNVQLETSHMQYIPRYVPPAAKYPLPPKSGGLV